MFYRTEISDISDSDIENRCNLDDENLYTNEAKTENYYNQNNINMNMFTYIYIYIYISIHYEKP